MENLNKEKQIEEMVKAMCGNSMSNGNCATDDEPCYLECVYGCCAEKLYAKGYRKQREGEWHYPPYAPFGGIYEMKRCSVCGYKPDIDSENPYTKFCPNCGAKMKNTEN